MHTNIFCFLQECDPNMQPRECEKQNLTNMPQARLTKGITSSPRLIYDINNVRQKCDHPLSPVSLNVDGMTRGKPSASGICGVLRAGKGVVMCMFYEGV